MVCICEYCNNFEQKGKKDERVEDNCKCFKQGEKNSCDNFALIFRMEFPGNIFKDLINNKMFDESFEFILSAILRGYADQRIFVLSIDMANQTLVVNNLTTGVESKPIKIKELETDYNKNMRLVLGKEMDLEFNVTNLSSSSKKNPIIAFMELKGSDVIYNVTSIKVPWYLKRNMMLEFMEIQKE